MDIQNLRDIFAVRFYQWAKQDALREINDGFPFLKTIKGSIPMRHLEIMEALHPDKCLRFAIARVKLSHPKAVEITGEFQTPEEKDLIQEYCNLARQSSQFENEIWRQRYFGSGPIKKVNKKKFAVLLENELARTFENSTLQQGANIIAIETQVGNWTVSTRVRSGQPPGYLQHIRAIEPVYLVEAVSMLSWMGICSQTDWNLLLTDEDAAQATKSITSICLHFTQAVPGLLDGLSHDLTQSKEESAKQGSKVRLIKRTR